MSDYDVGSADVPSVFLLLVYIRAVPNYTPSACTSLCRRRRSRAPPISFLPSPAPAFHILRIRDNPRDRGSEAAINYKAHIPAGLFLSALVAFVAGLPAVVPMLLGGMFGGALPDIDIEGSAVQKMGSKAAGGAKRLANKVTKGRSKVLGGITSAIGLAIDKMILTPICNAWRWLASNVLAKAYFAVYSLGAANGGKGLGESLHWDRQDPSSHRGGLTHSLLFLVGSSIISAPISLLFGDAGFWIGCEIGVISHLLTDAMCRSGVKFFWPFIIPIGFQAASGGRVGEGIRILPPQLQVSTGAANKTNQEIDNMSNEETARDARRLRRREIMWQWVFKLLALLFVILLFVGVGPAPGGLSMSMEQAGADQGTEQTATTQPAQQTQQATNETNANPNGGSNQSGADQSTNSDGDDTSSNSTSASMASTENIASDGGSVAGANPIDKAADDEGSVAETEGPCSLTYGDVSLEDLPKGVYKTPDEKLWIIGVGEVNEQNLENPKWVFTEDEKKALLRAAAAQRAEGIPDSAAELVQNAANAAGNALQNGAETANAAANAAGEGASGIVKWLQDVTGLGGDTSGYDGGFLGITPYT